MPVTPGVCGASLRSWAVTVDGYTLDNPYGWFSVYTDYAGWRALARQAVVKMKEHFANLGSVESAPYPMWSFYLKQHNYIIGLNQDLPYDGIWMVGGMVTSAIAEAIGVVTDALCMIELYDDAVRKIPGAPPPPKMTGSAKAEIKKEIDIVKDLNDTVSNVGDTVLKIGVVGLGAYILINLVKKK